MISAFYTLGHLSHTALLITPSTNSSILDPQLQPSHSQNDLSVRRGLTVYLGLPHISQIKKLRFLLFTQWEGWCPSPILPPTHPLLFIVKHRVQIPRTLQGLHLTLLLLHDASRVWDTNISCELRHFACQVFQYMSMPLLIFVVVSQSFTAFCSSLRLSAAYPAFPSLLH